jgi:hypothetical protein
MEAREWVKRYRKKARDLGKIKASAWWSKTLSDIQKKRGLSAINDLRNRMNKK